MLTDHSSDPGVSESVLVIAGGYDKRLAENREHYEELVDLIAELGLQSKVGTFRPIYHFQRLSRSEAWLGAGGLKTERSVQDSVGFIVSIPARKGLSYHPEDRRG